MKHINMKLLKSNEQGMVAIVITSVLMIVISLIVLGFTQTVRREQRQALDRQLSTQAFYAAESGVNLARKIINEQMDHGEATDKTSCDEGLGRYAGTYAIDSSTGTAITCLLVQPTVSSDEYQGVGSDSKVFKMTGAGGVTIPNVDISWQSDTPGGFAGCNGGVPSPSFPAAWSCSEPVLRVDIVPVDGALSQATLPGKLFTSFLYPVTTGSVPTAVASSNGTASNLGTISAIRCNSAPAPSYKYRCTARIQMGALTANSYGVRISGIYKTAAVSVSGRDSSGNPISLVNGQIIIDSTAKAVDVVRRIQARITIGSNVNDAPDFAIETGGALGLCKQYTITSGTYSWPGGTGCSIP